MKTGSKLAIILFIIVAIAHLFRLIFGLTLIIGDWHAPQWFSVLAVVGPGLLAWLLWKESK